MRIGLIVELNGTEQEGESPAPRWADVRGQALAAESVGFDSLVFEDGLLYEYGGPPRGLWESVSMAGAIAASTTTIEFGHSVLNAPYRSAAMMAKIALTLDEVSGGRYVFGIGAGNTPDSDYDAFGFPKDRRYSRFAEDIQVIHSLLKTGEVDFDGEFAHARNARTILDRVRPDGPPIVIAAGGPKMLRLVARYGDAWNWWAIDRDTLGGISQKVALLDEACMEIGRDPRSVRRTIDLYSVDPLQVYDGDPDRAPLYSGSASDIAQAILELQDQGVDEVRCHLHRADTANRSEAIEAMSEIVTLVHAG